ncbi:MAG: Xylose isomerase protein barrel [Mucilaginibacter sp.]|nr:Xylose isomerase protein barrel [Mucilaginibacter sp.]
MNRRKFIYQSSGLALTAMAAPAFAKFAPAKDKMDRIAMGTLIFRDRFKQTKPKQVETITNELTLMDIPQHHRDMYGIKKIEFWSEHFESLDKDYLTALKGKIKAAKCELLDVQFDSSQFDKTGYDLSNIDEDKRRAGIDHVKKWMDGASFLGSKCVRVNPGGRAGKNPQGTVENCIKSFTELLPYAKSKNLTIITANHTGLELNADNHVAILKGTPGLYSEPDFGNYNNVNIMYDNLAKIIPYAYIVSAKVGTFTDTDGKLEHTSYDFDKCMQLSESLNFRGNYMVAQWSGYQPGIDYEKVAAWTIERIKANIKA